MILFHAKRDGTVTTTPNFVPQGSSMQDLVVVSEFAYDCCAIKLLPASGEYIEDIPCTPILQKDYSTIFAAALPPKATVVAGSVDYQLIFTAADGATQATLVGSFSVPRGVPVSTPGSVEELSVKTIGDLYAIMANTYGLFAGHELDIADLIKLKSSAGIITIPASEWTDSAPTMAIVEISGVDVGSIILMLPANEKTRLAANNAKLSAYPVSFMPVGGNSSVPIFRAEAEVVPDADMTFAYIVLKTGFSFASPIAAIVGIDSYGEGGGASGGVDAEAVKALIREVVPAWARESKPPEDAVQSVNGKTGAVTIAIPSAPKDIGLGNVANERQYSATNPPPYPVATVNGKKGAVSLSAEDVGARPESWTPTAADVGAEINGTASALLSLHNINVDAHNDLRLEIEAHRAEVNALLNSDDETLNETKEIVAYIKSNKSLIDAITAAKVNVSDIVNDLVTNRSDRPLSAAQGAFLKALIDALTTTVDGKTTSAQVQAAIAEALKSYPNANKVAADIANAIANLVTTTALTETLGRYATTIALAEGLETKQPKGNYLTQHQSLDHLLKNDWGAENAGMILVVGGDGRVTITAPDAPPVVGAVEDKDILLSGDLAPGTYTVAYVVRKADGSTETVPIGTYTVEDESAPKTYTIKWCNYDGTILETDTVTEGETPVYNGATPTRAEDDQYTYTFNGWNKTVVAATADATYTATYAQTAKPVEPSYTNLFDPSAALLNQRYSSSSSSISLKEADGYVSSAQIPFKNKVDIPTLGQGTEESMKLRIRPAGLFVGDASIQYFQSPTYKPAGYYLTANSNNIQRYIDDNGDDCIILTSHPTAGCKNVTLFTVSLQLSSNKITDEDIRNIIITLDEEIV